MPTPEIEEFAKLLVERVRDSAIADCDILLHPACQSPTAKRWREKLNSGASHDVAEMMIPDSVDRALATLLDAMHTGDLRLSYVASNGKVVDLADEGLGELAGWYRGEWIEHYTRERFIDDFKHVKLRRPLE